MVGVSITNILLSEKGYRSSRIRSANQLFSLITWIAYQIHDEAFMHKIAKEKKKQLCDIRRSYWLRTIGGGAFHLNDPPSRNYKMRFCLLTKTFNHPFSTQS